MKRVLFAGLSGGIVMLAWLFVTNAVLPLKSDLIHRHLSFQSQVETHEALKENVTEPGTYSIPYLSREDEVRFPEYRNQPVFTVIFSGFTHGGGGGGSLLSSLPVILVAIFLPPFLAAWMLSLASTAITSRYIRRVLFVMTFGVIIALHDDVLQVSFGPLREDYLAFLAINHLLAWTLTALVLAGIVKPAGGKPTDTMPG